MAAGGRLAPLVRLLAAAADLPPADACALVRALLAGDSRASAAAREVRSSLVAACDARFTFCLCLLSASAKVHFSGRVSKMGVCDRVDICAAFTKSRDSAGLCRDAARCCACGGRGAGGSGGGGAGRAQARGRAGARGGGGRRPGRVWRRRARAARAHGHAPRRRGAGRRPGRPEQRGGRAPGRLPAPLPAAPRRCAPDACWQGTKRALMEWSCIPGACR
jgi:hypothetical protein